MKVLVIFHHRRDGWKNLMMGKNVLSDRYIDDCRKLIIGASQDENIHTITLGNILKY
ncbi:hypothetical protein [Okeania sp. SIO2B3]|uniref:hypothetical protein n=1 Tax=Okeania sp. SIO2B3 TaxID=2607784 RepID=UPI0013BFFFF4|nr:hypothetical protein [Okeania sp. SIO2B3]NEN93434.1 hypothetical protein [Okeania sp. SIO3H1]NET40895.1 hypothetical protein [Okeania sp. SIO2B3]